MTEISSIQQAGKILPQLSGSLQSGASDNGVGLLFGDNLIGGAEDSYTSDAVKSQLKLQGQELVKLSRSLNAVSSDETGGADALKKTISTKMKALKEQAENAGVNLNEMFSEIAEEMNLSRKDQKAISKNLKVKISKSDKSSSQASSQVNPFGSSGKSLFSGFSGLDSAAEITDAGGISPTVNPSYSKSPNVKLDKEFLDKTKAISERIGCDYKDLLAVMNSESGLKANARNSNGGATGLIQFMPDTARSLGTTTDQLAKMTPVQQLDYVEKFLEQNKKQAGMDGKKLSGADLYSLVFLPGRANRSVLTQSGEKYYSPNHGLDLDKDGNISKADLARRVASFYVDESKTFA